MNKITIHDCYILAKINGGICVSTIYINNHIKMSWECHKKHQWAATYNNIKQGYWCPKCAGNIKLTLEDACRLAELYGGKCLSSKYANNSSKMLWECKVKHQWSATYGNIQQGHWCPYCCKKAKHSLYDCQKLAEKYNGRCMSKVYKNALTKLCWECEEKHIWYSRFNDVDQGHWCPECAGNKHQRLLTDIIRGIFKNNMVYSDYTDFDWLKTTKNRKQEIDIWVPDLKLAIEYDGEQHFKLVRFGGIIKRRAKENLKNVKRLDKLKNKKIKTHIKDIRHFVRFNYKEPITIEYVREKLEKYCGAI